MHVWRLCKTRYSASVLAGEGGVHAGGRWHTRGGAVVYCASSESLAILEVRVHLGPAIPRDRFTMHEIEIPDRLVGHLDQAELSADWHMVPYTLTTQAIGDAWLSANRGAALRVPSIHSRSEFNVLLNPAHPRAKDIQVLQRRVCELDARLF